jgi:hypothetical protein
MNFSLALSSEYPRRAEGLVTILDNANAGGVTEITVGWAIKPNDAATALEGNGGSEGTRNDALIQSIARATPGCTASEKEPMRRSSNFDQANGLHPKVVRQALRLALLSPDVTSAILEGRQPPTLSLARIPKLLLLPWAKHHCLLG